MWKYCGQQIANTVRSYYKHFVNYFFYYKPINITIINIFII